MIGKTLHKSSIAISAPVGAAHIGIYRVIRHRQKGNCPVTPLLQKLQGKWKSQILYELCIHDPARFGEIKKDLPGIANATLSNVLKELEEDGFIKRVQFNEIPPHVEYSFTEKGRDLIPIFY